MWVFLFCYPSLLLFRSKFYSSISPTIPASVLRLFLFAVSMRNEAIYLEALEDFAVLSIKSWSAGPGLALRSAVCWIHPQETFTINRDPVFLTRKHKPRPFKFQNSDKLKTSETSVTTVSTQPWTSAKTNPSYFSFIHYFYFFCCLNQQLSILLIFSFFCYRLLRQIFFFFFFISPSLCLLC